MTNWKFSATPAEIDLGRIVSEASQALNDSHKVIKLTIGRQVFTLCTYKDWIETCPMVVPVGLVTRFSHFASDCMGGVKIAAVASPFVGGPDSVVVFNQDLARKIRGGVEVKVEVF